MKVLVNGLGPNETLTYKNMLLSNGAHVEMEEEHAKAYIKGKLVKSCEDSSEAKALQNLEIKNEQTRKRIVKKAAEKEGMANE